MSVIDGLDRFKGLIALSSMVLAFLGSIVLFTVVHNVAGGVFLLCFAPVIAIMVWSIISLLWHEQYSKKTASDYAKEAGLYLVGSILSLCTSWVAVLALAAVCIGVGINFGPTAFLICLASSLAFMGVCLVLQKLLKYFKERINIKTADDNIQPAEKQTEDSKPDASDKAADNKLSPFLGVLDRMRGKNSYKNNLQDYDVLTPEMVNRIAEDKNFADELCDYMTKPTSTSYLEPCKHAMLEILARGGIHIYKEGDSGKDPAGKIGGGVNYTLLKPRIKSVCAALDILHRLSNSDGFAGVAHDIASSISAQLVDRSTVVGEVGEEGANLLADAMSKIGVASVLTDVAAGQAVDTNDIAKPEAWRN